MSVTSFIEMLYEKHYKKLLIIPIILLIIFLLIVLVAPGVKQGLDLKGGTRIIVRTSQAIDVSAVELILKNKFDLKELQVSSVSSPAGNGLTVIFSEIPAVESISSDLQNARIALDAKNESDAIALMNLSISKSAKVTNLEGLGVKPDNSKKLLEFSTQAMLLAKQSINENIQKTILSTLKVSQENALVQLKEVGPTLGKNFWNTALLIAGLAIIFIAIIIFVLFRELIPSLAIIFSAIFDCLFALAFMAIAGMPLSLVSIPSLLMLVGYSIDTDILLTTRVLKRTEGTPASRASRSFNTGSTMTITTIAATIVMMTVAYFAQIVVVFDIAILLFFGLLGDLVWTWLGNAPILLWFVEHRQKKLNGGSK